MELAGLAGSLELGGCGQALFTILFIGSILCSPTHSHKGCSIAHSKKNIIEQTAGVCWFGRECGVSNNIWNRAHQQKHQMSQKSE